MPPSLFLDTARMGQPCQRAIAAQMSLAHFWAENGLSAQNDQLLADGWQTLDMSDRSRFFGLADWRGVCELKKSLQSLAGLESTWHTLLASRASRVMAVAVNWMTQRCDRVLYTDLLWPAYQSLIRKAPRVQLAQTEHLAGGFSEFIQAEFVKSSCDGLLLPAVTHLGFRLPYARIAAELAASSRLKCLVVDGAQEYCHVPTALPANLPCIYVTSAQKWLASGVPMGIGFLSPEVCDENLAALLESTDDSLLSFTCACGDQGLGETVAIAPLFAARAAVAELSRSLVESRFRTRLNNRRQLLQANLKHWAILDAQHVGSGMVTLYSPYIQDSREDELRRMMQVSGIVASAFPGGLIRLSMPAYEIGEADLEKVFETLDKLLYA